MLLSLFYFWHHMFRLWTSFNQNKTFKTLVNASCLVKISKTENSNEYKKENYWRVNIKIARFQINLIARSIKFHRRDFCDGGAAVSTEAEHHSDTWVPHQNYLDEKFGVYCHESMTCCYLKRFQVHVGPLSVNLKSSTEARSRIFCGICKTEEMCKTLFCWCNYSNKFLIRE